MPPIANPNSPPRRRSPKLSACCFNGQRIHHHGQTSSQSPAWQWRNYPQNHQHPTNLALHMIAVPLFIIGFLLIVSGVFSLSLASFAVGIVGLLAGLALQRHGHSLEAEASEPFSDRKDAVQRLVVEQFVTFPRFVLSGGWWRAWRQRHRH